MARRGQPLVWLWPGGLAVGVIVFLIGSALLALWLFAQQQVSVWPFWQPYWGRLIAFTLWQAALSTLLSVILAVILATVLSHCRFAGKIWFLRLLSVTFVLPSLVIMTGLLAVYGRFGWLARLCDWLGITYSISLYGLTGILIAHLLLNFPFASRLFYQALMGIAREQQLLAAQLNLSLWQRFRYLEWPVIYRQLLPTAGLIFMFCFASFAIVLTLGGGPKYTTLEVAIYQAIRDFQLQQAVFLALIQLVICLGLLWLFQRLTPQQGPRLHYQRERYWVPLTLYQKVSAILIIGASALFIGLPLLAIIAEGLYFFSWSLINAQLMSAAWFSFSIALGSAVIALILAIALLWTYSRLYFLGWVRSSQGLLTLGSLMLAIPSMVLAAGFFLLFFTFSNLTGFVALLVMLSNGLLALPLVIKYLEVPMADSYQRYYLLCQSLNISGLRHFYLIEWRGLKALFMRSFVLAMVISLGDFGIIALFGSQSLMTLPYYLYQQVAHYRSGESAVTALILLLSCLALMAMGERLSPDKK